MSKNKDSPLITTYKDFKNYTVIVAANSFRIFISYKRYGIGFLTVFNIWQEHK